MSAMKTIGFGCLTALATVGFLVVALVVLTGVGIGYLSSHLGAEATGDESVAREERVPERQLLVGGEDGAAGVLRVSIRGPITFSERANWLRDCAEGSAATALRHIRAAERDDAIRGLLLDLDTPGGGIAESDELWHAVRRFRESRRDRFVLAHMGGCCCSGGYYVASAADFIMARPTTMTGSIGVILSTVNAAELAKKAGVESVTIASGENKAMLDPLRPVSSNHVAILRRSVEAGYERFLSVVAQGRAVTVDKLRGLADGRVLTAQEALDARLVDAIGYREDAVAQLKKMAECGVSIYCYAVEPRWNRLLGLDAVSECAGAVAEGMAGALAPSPRLEYRLR